MASIARLVPKAPATTFRKACGCGIHWKVILAPNERRPDIRPSTWCRKADADREVRRIAAYLETRTKQIGPDPRSTVGAICETYLSQCRGRLRDPGREGAPDKASLAPGTVRSYERDIRLHIVPAIGGRIARGFTRAEGDSFTAALVADPRIGGDYVVQITDTLRRVFTYWMESGGEVTSHLNPVREKIAARSPRREWTPRDESDGIAIRDACPPDMRGLVDLHRYLGARGYCEVVAVREDDLIFTRLPGENTAAGMARLAALGEEEYAQDRARISIARKLEDDGRPSSLKTSVTVRTVSLDHWVVQSLAAHMAAWPPRDGWLFCNIRPAHGPYARDPGSQAELEADVARLWAEHIEPGSVPHGRAAAGTSPRALRFVVAAGRPVTTAEVAAHLEISPNTASAHLAQMARHGKLIRGGGERRAEWTPGERAEAAVAGSMTVGWSRAQIAGKLGTDASTVQRILRRLPANPDEPEYSYGMDGKVQPRERWDRPSAIRGDRPAWTQDGPPKLWRPWDYRRHLRQAADRAGVELDEGQVGHLFRHIRCSVLSAALVPYPDIAHHVGATVKTIQERYAHPVKGSTSAMDAIREASRRAGRPVLEVVPDLAGPGTAAGLRSHPAHIPALARTSLQVRAGAFKDCVVIAPYRATCPRGPPLSW